MNDRTASEKHRATKYEGRRVSQRLQAQAEELVCDALGVGTFNASVIPEAFTVEKLYRAEERIYAKELEYLDEKYGQPLYVVVHTDTEIPKSVIVWARRDGRPIYRSPYMENNDIIYRCNMEVVVGAAE